MGTRYHYDKHGRYRGKTTDKPEGGDLGAMIVCLFLFFIFFGGCVRGC